MLKCIIYRVIAVFFKSLLNKCGMQAKRITLWPTSAGMGLTQQHKKPYAPLRIIISCKKPSIQPALKNEITVPTNKQHETQYE